MEAIPGTICACAFGNAPPHSLYFVFWNVRSNRRRKIPVLYDVVIVIESELTLRFQMTFPTGPGLGSHNWKAVAVESASLLAPLSMAPVPDSQVRNEGIVRVWLKGKIGTGGAK